MVVTKEHKAYQALLKKGNGSILKGIRFAVGGGRGMIAGGITLLVFGVIFGFPLVFVDGVFGLVTFGIFLLPALLLIFFGVRLKKKRESTWLDYYKEKCMLTEGELMQFDREMATSSVRAVVSPRPNERKLNYVAGIFGENHVLLNSLVPFVSRAEDILAVAFSDSGQNWGVVILTKKMDDIWWHGLFADTHIKRPLYEELVQEMCRLNPEIIVGQEIVCEGKYYILERDGKKLAHLYKQGYKLEAAE